MKQDIESNATQQISRAFLRDALGIHRPRLQSWRWSKVYNVNMINFVLFLAWLVMEMRLKQSFSLPSFLAIIFKPASQFQPNMTEMQQQFQLKFHELRQVRDRTCQVLVPIEIDDNTARLNSVISGEPSEKRIYPNCRKILTYQPH